MEEQHIDQPKRLWDACREVPVIEDEQTPWKLLKLLKFTALSVVAVLVFGLALCSKTSFLLLITFANEGTKILPDEQRPIALLCIGCTLVASSILLLFKSTWKACYKTSKLPARRTAALILFIELLVSVGAAILTIVVMPHLDIVTNVTILNGVGVISAILQVVAQCSAKERKRSLLPSVAAFILITIGYVLFVVLYIIKDPGDTQMATWVGLAVGASFLVSLNWWENYLRLISTTSSSAFLRELCADVERSQNMLHILSSLLRVAVIACVLGAYVPLDTMDWDIVTSIPSRETRIVAITVGVQLVSSVLCYWFSLAACKMHALRRCFILPLYLASLAVMALLVVPVIVYYEDHRASLNGTAGVNFTSYCSIVVDGRTRDLNGSVFPHLVLDVTHTMCFLDMSRVTDIGLLTGSAVSWWLGLVMVTLHLWHLSVYRIQRTQDLFIRRLYEGPFIEQSLLLNTRFDPRTTRSVKRVKKGETVKIFLCATMWHETWEEMMNLITSIFRLDKYRPRKHLTATDFIFEAHIYFDDAFEDVAGNRGRILNSYAETLVEVITEVYEVFMDLENKVFRENRQIPSQSITRTPYGGRLTVSMPDGNSLIAHFKDRNMICQKKRWSQVMYLYYLLGWKLTSKYFMRWHHGEDEKMLRAEFEKEKHKTYILMLDGDTDFQPAALMMLIDRLRMYPKVGAACGRIHPIGSGPAVWFQKFEYAVGHWLQKTAEHVFGSVLCSPGCFSLFRAEALMDDNVIKTYSSKSVQASHHIQHDQGEDRWLCTLLLKRGWRVEYNAASDAYTNAPEGFKELYNQRRRWGPSTLANISDLLGSTTSMSKRNSSVSKIYMLYQLCIMISIIMAPATICLLVASGLRFVFGISGTGALIISTIPPAVFLGLCFKLKSDTQIIIAAVLSVIYASLMLVVIISIVGVMVVHQTILTPSSIFILFMAFIYVVTALMHPQEFPLLFYSFIYIICIPSAYLLLIIYSMVNMNNISWGTREAKPATETATTPQTAAEKAKSACQRFLSWAKCCKDSSQANNSEKLRRHQDKNAGPEKPGLKSLNNISEGTVISEIDGGQDASVLQHPVEGESPDWVTRLQSLSSDMNLREDVLSQEEQQFFMELQEAYLQPLPHDENTQKKIVDELRDLRNRVNFVFFMVNALWLVAAFTLQTFHSILSIKLPMVDMSLEFTGRYIIIDPIAFMFLLGFVLSIIIQFFAMLWHRISTLIHYVAFLDTEPRKQKDHEPHEYLPGQQDADSSQAATFWHDAASFTSSSFSSQFSIDTAHSDAEDSDHELYVQGSEGRIQE